MKCTRCGNEIDFKRGDMTAILHCEDHQFAPMQFCMACLMDFLDWAEGRK